MNEWFRELASGAAARVGSAPAFFFAALLILVWAATGPLFAFSDTWELFINTVTTIVTFLMVFLIQSAQNRDAKAIQLKLDELLRGVVGARTSLVALEQMSDAELDALELEFRRLRARETAAR
jgi:low affinity Fe/Cu permease